MSAIVVQPAKAAVLAAQREALASRFDEESHSPETRRKYAGAWIAFEIWCAEAGVASLPATIDTVRHHLSELALTHGLSSVAIRQAAIMLLHKRAGHAFDEEALARLHVTTRGIRRTKSLAKRQAPPLDAGAFAKLVARLPADMAGLRDRALVGIGFDFFLRRSELSRLDVGDVAISEEGLRLTIRDSKTLKGRARTFSRPRRPDRAACPVAWLEDWIEAAGGLPDIRVRGVWCRPVFRAVDRFGNVLETRLSGDSIRRIVRDRARAAGLPAKLSGDFSAHSMRSGGITAALDGGLDISIASDQATHARIDTTRIYDRRKEKDLGTRVAAATAAAFYPERASDAPAPPVRVQRMGPATALDAAAAALARTLEETDRFTRPAKKDDQEKGGPEKGGGP